MTNDKKYHYVIKVSQLTWNELRNSVYYLVPCQNFLKSRFSNIISSLERNKNYFVTSRFIFNIFLFTMVSCDKKYSEYCDLIKWNIDWILNKNVDGKLEID